MRARSEGGEAWPGAAGGETLHEVQANLLCHTTHNPKGEEVCVSQLNHKISPVIKFISIYFSSLKIKMQLWFP